MAESIPDEVMRAAWTALGFKRGSTVPAWVNCANRVALALMARDKRAAEIARRKVIGGYMHGAPEWADGDDIATAILTYGVDNAQA